MAGAVTKKKSDFLILWNILTTQVIKSSEQVLYNCYYDLFSDRAILIRMLSGLISSLVPIMIYMIRWALPFSRATNRLCKNFDRLARHLT